MGPEATIANSTPYGRQQQQGQERADRTLQHIPKAEANVTGRNAQLVVERQMREPEAGRECQAARDRDVTSGGEAQPVAAYG